MTPEHSALPVVWRRSPGESSTVQRIAFALPLLGWVGGLVLIGWKLGPWLPVGLTAATALLLGYGWYRARVPREIEGNAAAVREWRDERTNRVGRWLGAMTAIWVSVSLVLLVLIVVVALLTR